MIIDILDHSNRHLSQNVKQRHFQPYFTAFNFDHVQSRVLPRLLRMNVETPVWEQATRAYAAFHPESELLIEGQADLFTKIQQAQESGIKRVSLEINLEDKGLHKLLKQLHEKKSNLPIEVLVSGSRPFAFIKEESWFKTQVEPYLSEFVSFRESAGSIPQSKSSPCTFLFDLQILHNGDVRLCGCHFEDSVFDDLVVGNLLNDSLANIWFSEKVFELRREFFNSKIPKTCQSCRLFEAIGNKRFFLKEELRTSHA